MKNFSFRKGIVFIILSCIFLCVPRTVQAITLDSSSYYVGDAIPALNGGGPLILFDLNSDTPLFSVGGYDADWNINYFDIAPGNYSIIELTSADSPCYAYVQTLAECKDAPQFANEFLFSVSSAPPAGNGGNRGGGDSTPSDSDEASSHNYNAYYPTVFVSSPGLDSIFSDKIGITYEATDPNDTGVSAEKELSGLGQNPVSIFYSEKSIEWTILHPQGKISVVKNQPALGTYVWSTKDLIPGNLYQIIVDAVDLSGKVGEAFSEFFAVDYTPPTFIVKTDPPAIRKGTVKISVEVSEELAEPPSLTVTQKSAGPVGVTLSSWDKRHFEGVYTVLTGYDGTARIGVTGSDKAGNVGTTTVSGGTFSVGINPPPKPTIDSTLIKKVVREGSITLQGKIREDTRAVLSINGVEVTTVTPDANGIFVFNNIQLSKTDNKGVNFLSVTSKDVFDTLSESAVVNIKYNSSPEVVILKPLQNELVNSQVEVVTKSSDKNGDTLTYSYQILPARDFGRPNSENLWTTIAEGEVGNSFLWNTTEGDDGEYMIRVIADDGIDEATSTPVKIISHNTLPFFRFENGRKTVTNKNKIVIAGRVLTSEGLPNRPNIKKAEYSLDNGVTWTGALLTPSGFSPEKKFSVTLNYKKDGTYPVLWRVQDDRDFFGNGLHLVTLDTTPPRTPTLTTTFSKNLVTDSDDENQKQPGVQFALEGISEPLSIVTLAINGRVSSTKSLATGNFSFKDFSLTTKGKNELRLFVTDSAGNIGAVATVVLSYNNPPSIVFLNPKPFRGISTSTVVAWKITDPDKDSLDNIGVSYRVNEGAFTNLLPDPQAVGSYLWDVSRFSESNDYELRISATDGMSPVSAVESFSIDRTPPTLGVIKLNEIPLQGKNAFEAHGEARDSVSGIEFVEYAFGESSSFKPETWYKAVITQGYLQHVSSFLIKYPFVLPDGTYRGFVRAVDAAGNLSSENPFTFRIDKTAPRIGSFSLVHNAVRLSPDEKGQLILYKDTPTVFEVSLEDDTQRALLTVGDTPFELKKNLGTGLWETLITAHNESTSTELFISADDVSHNSVSHKRIGNFVAMSKGVIVSHDEKGVDTPVSGVRILVLRLQEDTQEYAPFKPLSDKALTVETDAQGEYALALPQGTYRIVARKSGYGSVEEKIVLTQSGLVTPSFTVQKISGIRMFIETVLDLLRY